MLTINKLIPQARGLAPVLTKRAASVELDWNVRQTSRFDATDSLGRVLGVALPDGTLIRVGDMLVGEDGSLIAVRAAFEPVLLVRHCSKHGSPFDLVRAAYDLGRRNVQLQLSADFLKLQLDPVQASLLREMHLIVSEANDVFEPEGDAPVASKHEPAAAPAHVHGPGCGHDHGHDHIKGHDHKH